jgi:hypothetical protein
MVLFNGTEKLNLFFSKMFIIVFVARYVMTGATISRTIVLDTSTTGSNPFHERT